MMCELEFKNGVMRGKSEKKSGVGWSKTRMRSCKDCLDRHFNLGQSHQNEHGIYLSLMHHSFYDLVSSG